MCAQVFSRYSGFLPQSWNRLVRLTADSKLPPGMNEWYVYPPMDRWPVLREQKTKPNGWVDGINAVTSSSTSCSSAVYVCLFICFKTNMVWMVQWPYLQRWSSFRVTSCAPIYSAPDHQPCTCRTSRLTTITPFLACTFVSLSTF